MKSRQKLFIIFHGRFPSEKAASIMAAKSAESFSDVGFEVVLLVPRRLKRVKKTAADFYNIKDNFKVKYLPTIDIYGLPFITFLAFYVSFIIFSFSTAIYLLLRAKRDNIIYSNESLPLVLASLFFPNIYYEIHDFPEKKSGYYEFLIKIAKGLIITNQWKVNKIKERYGLDNEKILYEPNGVEIEEFDIDLSKSEARKKLNLPQEKRIVVYTGHLFKWKGVDVLAQATDKLPDDYEIYFIGGTQEEYL